MSDLVERLRRGDPCGDCKRDRCACVIMEDAADEITRLRNELHIAQVWSERVIAGHEQDVIEIARIRAENERLRAALGDVHAAAKDNHLVAKLARAALEEK